MKKKTLDEAMNRRDLGSKRGHGYKWHLTDERRERVEIMLQNQMTLRAIARHYGISDVTLASALKRAGVNWKEVRNEGLHRLRSRVYGAIYEIDDPEKIVDSGLKFLKQYPIEEDSRDGSEDNARHSVVDEILSDLTKE